jgi:hypothetical protein
VFAASAILGATLQGQAVAEDQKSDPPAKPAPSSIMQPSPQGDPGQLETDSSKGSVPSSPQGGTPNSMQVKPKGEDKGSESK